jgi:hypothetical protein
MLGEEGAVMTTLDDVTKKRAAEQEAVVELVRLALEQGLLRGTRLVVQSLCGSGWWVVVHCRANSVFG